jgi:superfamily II DNA or RNA helicase
MIQIEKIDDVFIKVHSDESTAKELSSFFTFKVPNHQFTPAFRRRRWDGKVRLFNFASRTIYAGLLEHLEEFMTERSYAYEKINFNSSSFSAEYIDNWLSDQRIYSDGKEITPHDYQLSAVKQSILKSRILLLSPTGSGKSLIIFLILKFLLEHNEHGKFLIVVPTTGLVSQLSSEFSEYSNKDLKWSRNIHCIFSGQEKTTNKRIVVSTWQSIFRQKPEFFKDFIGIFGDEAHGHKSKSLMALMQKLRNCPFRIGTTGTLDGVNCHKLMIEGMFGRCFKVTSTKKLIDNKVLSNLKINCILFSYDEQEKRIVKKAKYPQEIEWIVKNPKRNKFICDLVEHLEGNVLLLFNYVDNQGLPLYQYLKKKSKKDVFMIYGKTDTDEREDIRKIVDKNKNSVLVASYGTCSTGISIKNINHVIFASPSKSIIRIQQSIGRGLRKSDIKDKVTVYDLGDDLRHLSYRNHTLRHMDDRLDLYNTEGFPFEVKKIRL